MIYTRIVHGWVAQKFDSETGDCISQEFIAEEGSIERNDEEGNPIPEEDQAEMANMEKEMTFDMVQP